MRKILLILITTILLSGCVTERACERKFPTQLHDSINIVERVVLRDTTIFVQLPADTIRDTIHVYIYNGLAQSKRSELSTMYAYSFAQVVNGKLIHELQQRDTTLARVIENAVKESSKVEYKYSVKTVTTNELTGWQWFQVWLGRVLAVAFIMILAIKRF